ncbi:MAG TPA: hypothetical protein VFP84_09425, partial [Kofleriaceae bacterium]|nr:hypothetical protein [Kofleriaceae bacterium]
RLPPALLARAMAHDPALLGAFGPEVRTLSPDRRAALATAWLAVHERFPIHGTYLLRHLPADPAREHAYLMWSFAARDADGAIPVAQLAELPIDLAAREAARHVEEVVALATSPHRRLAGIARYLAWPALERAVHDHLGHPEGTMRALAIRELIAHPGVYPDDAALPARALALITARKFEQDPVRQTMLGELERWPRRLWRAAHLPAVAQIVRDALDAADLSLATATIVQRLIARLFGVDPAWAATWLATAIQERGGLYDANLGAKLSDDDLRVAAPHLVAIAKTWATQERASWLVAFAAGLGPRLHFVTGLAEMIAKVRDAIAWEAFALQLTEVLARWAPALHAETLPAALARFAKRNWHAAILSLARLDGVTGRDRPRARHRRRAPLAPPLTAALVQLARKLDDRDSPTALAVLRDRDPEAFDALLIELIADDESVIALAPVRTWIDRHRQDLLDGYIEGRTIRGQWSTGKSRWIMTFGAGYHRWSPAQCERHAAALEAIVGDAERDIPAVLTALTTWPQIAWASQARLVARASDGRPAVREKAIRVLARCDAGQGVPTLLACLADDRARFAIYGLRRALFAMPPDRALALLADAPMRKLTVGKEVIRLTGELRAAAAFARLEALSRADLHRDLRIALLRALWDHLDHAPTWAIFERAVADPDWVVASRLADIPANRLTAALDARLSALLARLLDRPEPEARLGLLERTRSLAVADRPRALLAAILARLASPFDDEARAAMSAVLARAADDDLPLVRTAFRDLTRDPRAFHAAADQLLAHDIRARASWRAIAAQLVTAAVADPRLTPITLRVAARRAHPADFVATLATAPLDADALSAALSALPSFDADTLPALVAALASSPRPELRRLAVAALTLDAAPARGWTATRLAQLTALRADPSPLVAGAAARLWPPREHDPGW